MADVSHEGSGSRSGCAVFVGVAFIAIGGLVLAHNLLLMAGVASYTFVTQALRWFGTLWPVVFIVWGAYKVWSRSRDGGRTTVSWGEVALLVCLLVLGLAASGGKRLLDHRSVHVSADELADVLGPEFLGPSHVFVREETLELSEVESLHVSAQRGSVTVLGTDEEQLRLVVRKRVHDPVEAEAERKADRLRVSLGSSGGVARVEVEESEASRGVVADLEIRVPRRLEATVASRRGPIRVTGLSGGLDARTRYGLLEVVDVGGDVRAETSHSDLRLERIGGSVDATNRHGAVALRTVVGEVVARATNGGVLIEDASAGATIETRRGRVRVERIAGRLQVTARYGEISVEGAEADVALTANNRPVFVSGVDGSVSVEAKNSSILVRDVEGDVRVDNRYRTVLIRDVRGEAHVSGRQSAVDVDTVAGKVTVEASHEDVRVHDFGAGLEVRATHADLVADSARLGGDVVLETTYGDVTLRVAPDASATIEASLREGELESAFGPLEGPATEGETERFSGTLGGGGARVRMDSVYGDIRIERRDP